MARGKYPGNLTQVLEARAAVVAELKADEEVLRNSGAEVVQALEHTARLVEGMETMKEYKKIVLII